MFFENALTGLRKSSRKTSVSLVDVYVDDVSMSVTQSPILQTQDYYPFGLSFGFEGGQLDQSSFYRTKLKKTVFKNIQLKEVDLTECDLASAVFDHCDLAGATFENTILEKADLRTSFNYSIDPERNRVKKAKFSLQGLPGLLNKYDIEIH